MPQSLPRAFRAKQQAEDERKLEKILAQTAKLEPSDATGATSGGDESRLRGLPAIGRGCEGRDRRISARRGAQVAAAAAPILRPNDRKLGRESALSPQTSLGRHRIRVSDVRYHSRRS